MLTIRTAHSGHRQDEDDRRYTPRAGASHAAPAHRPNSDTESWASSSTGSYSADDANDVGRLFSSTWLIRCKNSARVTSS